MVLTFQVINPSINYTVGEKYTLAEALFEMANRQSSARRIGARSGIAFSGRPGRQKVRAARPADEQGKN
jgi:hypothetical protein